MARVTKGAVLFKKQRQKWHYAEWGEGGSSRTHKYPTDYILVLLLLPVTGSRR